MADTQWILKRAAYCPTCKGNGYICHFDMEETSPCKTAIVVKCVTPHNCNCSVCTKNGEICNTLIYIDVSVIDPVGKVITKEEYEARKEKYYANIKFKN